MVWGRYLLFGHLEPLFGHFEPLFGHFEPLSGHLEPLFGHFEPLFGHFEPLFGHFERFKATMHRAGAESATGTHGGQKSMAFGGPHAGGPVVGSYGPNHVPKYEVYVVSVLGIVSMV